MNQKLKVQSVIGIALLILTLIWAANVDDKLGLYLISGLMLGYTLSRARFGYAGGIKLPYMTGQTSLTAALFVMFTLTAVGTAGIHYMGTDGINFMRSVRPFDLGVAVGGFLFGAGMMLSGGCASGTLTDLGEGFARAAITYLFYILGSPIGHQLRVSLGDSSLKNFSVEIYFPEYIGYFGSVVMIGIAFLLLYIIVDRYSKSRRNHHTYVEPEYEEIEKAVPVDPSKGFFSYHVYHKLFIERWSFMTCGLVMSVIFIFILITSGKSWGVTSSFTVNGVWLLGQFGMDFSQTHGFEKIAKQASDLSTHAGTLRNATTVLGAMIAFLLAGRFALNFKFSFKDVLIYALGGLLMGIGARYARGCNVGALYAAITNFSFHGWGFMLFMTFGGISALKVFEGKVNIIPNRKK